MFQWNAWRCNKDLQWTLWNIVVKQRPVIAYLWSPARHDTSRHSLQSRCEPSPSSGATLNQPPSWSMVWLAHTAGETTVRVRGENWHIRVSFSHTFIASFWASSKSVSHGVKRTHTPSPLAFWIRLSKMKTDLTRLHSNFSTQTSKTCPSSFCTNFLSDFSCYPQPLETGIAQSVQGIRYGLETSELGFDSQQRQESVSSLQRPDWLLGPLT
jgi:hypothetical protein